MVAFLFSVLVYIVYFYTCEKTIYSKKFNSTMSMMSIVTAAIVLSMQANIVISLGMVGALSIVRFRTAIKEPKDLLFLFWSISNGIIIGAGLYSVAFILFVVLAVALFFFEILPFKHTNMLLVVNLSSIDDALFVEKKLTELNIKFNAKSKNVLKERTDIIYEIYTTNDDELLKVLSKNKKILSINLIRQD